MSIYMSPVESTLPDDSDFSAYANLQVGSNGYQYGEPTQILGDIWGDEDWAYNVWEGNTQSGFDTGSVNVIFDATSGGSESLYMGSTEVASYDIGSIGNIGSVVVEAGVQTNAEVKWSGLSVEFLHNGSVVETDSGSDIDVNTISSGTSNTADQTETFTPSVTNADQVIVSGTIRMRSPGISTPDWAAMFCKMLVA